ncbi:MAG TPA: DUF1549 domain-containing protein [Planctomycetota bacterium]|nr:DUF1549 domain-containing protein [Planctomycetota bacterium]
MVRIALRNALLATSLLVGAGVAQTAAPNPQRPEHPVASVRPLKAVLEDAARLDALLLRGLRRHREEPLPPVDDATFARRAYLGIVGRIPTLAETEAFLADQAPDKRTTLTDRLLDSPGHTSHFANFWFDELRLKSRQQNLSGEPFAHYVRQSIQTDKPYDRFVREMLVAEGPGHAEGNGATGMLLRDPNMPHDAMANAMRLFLGTRIECAQCHNHPFDVWTQKQFFEMAAFFGGMRYRDENALPNLVGLRTELANADDRTRQQARQLIQRLNVGLDGSGSGMERLPKDYKYDDLKPGSPIEAHTLFGDDVKLKYPAARRGQPPRRDAPRGRGRPGGPEVDSREALAEWLTSPKNPLFAKVIANRMWARTFGRGLVEPIDDWKKDTEAVHPELMQQLEKLMIDLGFDLRQFERVLVHTQLFQCEAPKDDPDPEQAYTFRGPLLRRMTAEQMWDSLLTLVFDDLDDRLRAPDARARPVYEQHAEAAKADAQELIAMVQQRRGAAQPMRAMQQQQAEQARMQLAADAELQRRARPLLQKMAQARRNGDQQEVAAIAGELERIGLPLGRRANRGREGDLLRASDLPQPAPPNHLLRQFGQSSRDTVDSASDVATVPQVLTLLNGFLDQRVLEGQSALRRDLELATNGERRVRIAFLTTLNREPTTDEVQEWRRAIAIDGPDAVKDLVWVLCNSNEFRFVR